MKAKHLVTYALLTCLFIVFSQSAGVSNASSPISDRFPISTISNAPTHAGELNPSVAYGAFQGRYLVVWDQLNTDSSASVVYGQFVNSGGTLNGSRFPISPLGGYNQYPDVAYNSTNDQFLVAYEVGGIGIYGQILTNAGSPVGTEFNIVNSTGGTPQLPAVAYCAATNQYLVTWQVTQGASKGIEARVVNADGTVPPVAPLSIVGLVTIIQPAEPDIAYDSAVDQCLIAWQQWASVSDTTQHDVRGQRVHMTGGAHLEGSNFAIHSSTDDEVNPAVAALPEPAAYGGAYLVVCQRWYTSGMDVTSLIDGCRIGGDGTNLGISYISSSTGYTPAVVDSKNAKEYLVAWAFDNYTLQARFVDYSGGVTAASPQLFGVYLSRPAVASGSSVSFLVAYQDLYTSGYPTDIYGWPWGSPVYLPFVAKSY